MGSALRRACRAALGDKATYAGREVDPRYTPRSATMMGWLGVTAHEARCANLRLLVPRDVYLERERARSSNRRAARGCVARAEYTSHAALRASEAARLRRSGHGWADVARELGMPSSDAARKLAGRAADPQEGASQGPDKSDQVTSGVAPQEASLPDLGNLQSAWTASPGDLASLLAQAYPHGIEVDLPESNPGTLGALLGGRAARESGLRREPFQHTCSPEVGRGDRTVTLQLDGNPFGLAGTQSRRWLFLPASSLGNHSRLKSGGWEPAGGKHANDNQPCATAGSTSKPFRQTWQRPADLAHGWMNALWSPQALWRRQRSVGPATGQRHRLRLVDPDDLVLASVEGPGDA